MIDNIEDWLNSLNNVEVHDLSESSSTETSEPAAESPVQVSNVVAVNEDTDEEINTEPQPMPNDEFAELLSNIGYAPSSEQAEFEEVTDESVQENPDEMPETENTPIAEAQSEAPLIPENSPTLLVEDATSRFSGTEWYEKIKEKRVLFAGLGGIGSWAALLIGRMGISAIELYDADTIERANMSGQLYSRLAVGSYKSEVLRSTIMDYTNSWSVYSHRCRFTENTPAADIMICGFDNMEARKIFFNAWSKHVALLPPEEKKNCLYLDGRLSIDVLQVFCIQGEDFETQMRYKEKYLFSDEEADETVCSMKQTSYLAAMIGSIITNLFTNWVANSIDPIIPYDLPFFTEYNAQHMIFKTEH